MGKGGEKDSPAPTQKREIDKMGVVKKLRKMPSLMHMYDVLHFSPTARFTMEQVLSKIAMRNEVEDAFYELKWNKGLYHGYRVYATSFAHFKSSEQRTMSPHQHVLAACQ